MKGEIGRDFYCSANFLMIDGSKCKREICGIDGCCEDYCPHLHRKYPTPEQFKEEYGEDVPEDMPVWYIDSDDPLDVWEQDSYANAVEDERYIIVIACTPIGSPDNDWRPE